jgi:hypothetical protein
VAFASRRLTAEETRLVSHGGRIPAADGHRDPVSAGEDGDSDKAAAGAPVAAFDPDGNLTALLVRQDGEMKPLAVFVP